MPYAAARPCVDCGALVTDGSARCAQHRRSRERERGSSAKRGYDWQWRKLRSAFLQRHPTCAHCAEQDHPPIIEAATEVDHIVPHRGDDQLRLAWSNLQSLCKPCHSRKTATQDSGFARG